MRRTCMSCTPARNPVNPAAVCSIGNRVLRSRLLLETGVSASITHRPDNPAPLGSCRRPGRRESPPSAESEPPDVSCRTARLSLQDSQAMAGSASPNDPHTNRTPTQTSSVPRGARGRVRGEDTRTSRTTERSTSYVSVTFEPPDGLRDATEAKLLRKVGGAASADSQPAAHSPCARQRAARESELQSNWTSRLRSARTSDCDRLRCWRGCSSRA